MRFFPFFIITTIVAVFSISGCSAGEEDNKTQQTVLGKFEFRNGWARPGPEGGNSAAYMIITNGTATDDTLTGISSAVSGRAALHETSAKDGITEMVAITESTISSGSSFELKPGGKHIMLMQLERELTAGDSIALTLDFVQAGSFETVIPVRMQE